MDDAMQEVFYGPRISPRDVPDLVLANYWANLDTPETQTAFCLWGAPGVGKTSILRALCDCPVEYDGKKFDGFKIVYLPLAFFEEKGEGELDEDEVEAVAGGKLDTEDPLGPAGFGTVVFTTKGSICIKA